jgi:squalene synthase HpnC
MSLEVSADTSHSWAPASSSLAQARAENFTVASLLLPRETRQHLMAVYGFARMTDDVGDEAIGDRLAMLDALQDELTLAARGEASHPILVSLTPTLGLPGVPLDPFVALIEANRQDQLVTRYETFDELVDYCLLSAAPIGRLVLAIFEATTPRRVALSDDVCVGLQLVEHLQDVAEDAARGRVYLPQVELRAAGVDEVELTAGHASPALRRVVAVTSTRARRLLASGRELSGTLPLRARLAVGGYAAGGLAVADEISRARYDVLGTRCRPRRRTVLRHLVAMTRGRA